MNSVRAGALLTLPLLMAAAIQMARADNASDRKAIAAAYAANSKAFARKDVAAMDSTMAPDFKGISKTGQVVDREESIAQLEQIFDMIQPGAVDSEKIQSITFRPDGAIVNVKEAALVGIMGPDGRPHKIRIDTSSRDFWVKTRAGWRIKQSRQLTNEQVSVDRKIIKLRKRKSH